MPSLRRRQHRLVYSLLRRAWVRSVFLAQVRRVQRPSQHRPSIPRRIPKRCWRLCRVSFRKGRDIEAAGLAIKVLGLSPDRRSDGRVAEALYKLANSATKEASDKAFALLEGTMATKGADILYQLWLDKGVRDTTHRRAEKWLKGEPFARTASNALVIAVRLRMAESCEKKYEMLPLAAKGGTAFAPSVSA